MLPNGSEHPVLVVEDELFTRLDLIGSIEDAGHFAVEAASADAAMALLDHFTFSLVWTDVDMPGELNGVDLAFAVKERCPETEVVIGSGMVRPTPSELPAGVLFVPKPYSIKTVRDTIRTLVH